MAECILCPRRCQIDRNLQRGFCGCTYQMKVARIGLHFYEEPPISGTRGSGAIFFSGCNLRCVFCQNMVLQKGELGQYVTPAELAAAMLSMEKSGAHNINLVTPTPHVEGLLETLALARQAGLHIPVVYNTNAYMERDTVRRLSEYVDIWLPDLKYFDPQLSKAFSAAADYFETAIAAITEMYACSGPLRLEDNGLAKTGVLIRHLVLPGCIYDTRKILSVISEHFGVDAPVSLMCQYTPREDLKAPLNRRLTRREYENAIDHAIALGMTNVFTQEAESATFAYTPEFSDHIEIPQEL